MKRQLIGRVDMWQQFIMMLLMVILVSCGNQDYTDIEENQGGEPVMKLRISTLAAQSTAAQGVVEKIKSLRVVMLSDGFVEYNAKFDYTTDEGAKAASTFTHVLERATVPGNKSFYLFANEESVKSVNFDGITELPEWITQDLSLGDFLNHYTRDKLPAQGTLGYTNSGSGSEFEQLVNSLYFSPDYTITDNTVYLPYTSYYTGYQATNDPDLTLEVSMFLVPVATKFTFNFFNYREEDVDVKGITIGCVPSDNFLMAHLSEEEKNKKLDGEDYYWIDWLGKVVGGTHSAFGSGNDAALNDYNKKVGWIKEYALPKSGNFLQYETLSQGRNWTVAKLTDKDNPECLKVELYCPESLHTLSACDISHISSSSDEEKVETQTEIENTRAQRYFVKFEIQEKSAKTSTVSDWMELDALPALFRCTHLITNVDMYKSLVQIYCEIGPWDVWTFKGYVKEEEDD